MGETLEYNVRLTGDTSGLRKMVEASLRDIPISLSTGNLADLTNKISAGVKPKINFVADMASVRSIKGVLERSIGEIKVKIGVDEKELAKTFNKAFNVRISLDDDGSLKKIGKVVGELTNKFMEVSQAKDAFAQNIKEKFPQIINSVTLLNQSLSETERHFAQISSLSEGIVLKNPRVAKATVSNSKKSKSVGTIDSATADELDKISKRANKLEKDLTTLAEKYDKLTKSQKDAGQAAGTFAQRLVFSGARLTAYAIPAFAIFKIREGFDYATRSVIELDKHLNSLAQTLGNNQERASKLADSLLRIATQTAQPSDQVLSISQSLFKNKSLFGSDKEVLDTTSLISKSGLVNGFTDLKETTGGLISSLSIFNKQGADAANVLDLVSKAQKNADVTASELFEGIQSGGEIFQSAGGKIEEYIAIISSMVNKMHLPAGQIAASFNNIVEKSRTPEALRIISQVTGKSTRDPSGELKPFLQTMTELGKATENYTKAQLSALFRELGDVRQQRFLIAFLDEIRQARDGTSDLGKMLKELGNSTGEFSRTAALGLDTFDAQIQSIGSRFNEVFKDIKENEGVRALAKDFAELAKSVASTLQFIEPLIPSLVKLGTIKLLSYGVNNIGPGIATVKRFAMGYGIGDNRTNFGGSGSTITSGNGNKRNFYDPLPSIENESFNQFGGVGSVSYGPELPNYVRMAQIRSGLAGVKTSRVKTQERLEFERSGSFNQMLRKNPQLMQRAISESVEKRAQELIKGTTQTMFEDPSVNKKGIVGYHGTSKLFDKFQAGSGTHLWLGSGIYFGKDTEEGKENAREYAGESGYVYKTRLNIKKAIDQNGKLSEKELNDINSLLNKEAEQHLGKIGNFYPKHSPSDPVTNAKKNKYGEIESAYEQIAGKFGLNREKANSFLKKLGYDAVSRKEWDGIQHWDEYNVFSPEQVSIESVTRKNKLSPKAARMQAGLEAAFSPTGIKNTEIFRAASERDINAALQGMKRAELVELRNRINQTKSLNLTEKELQQQEKVLLAIMREEEVVKARQFLNAPRDMTGWERSKNRFQRAWAGEEQILAANGTILQQGKVGLGKKFYSGLKDASGFIASIALENIASSYQKDIRSITDENGNSINNFSEQVHSNIQNRARVGAFQQASTGAIVGTQFGGPWGGLAGGVVGLGYGYVQGKNQGVDEQISGIAGGLRGPYSSSGRQLKTLLDIQHEQSSSLIGNWYHPWDKSITFGAPRAASARQDIRSLLKGPSGEEFLSGFKGNFSQIAGDLAKTGLRGGVLEGRTLGELQKQIYSGLREQGVDKDVASEHAMEWIEQASKDLSVELKKLAKNIGDAAEKVKVDTNEIIQSLSKGGKSLEQFIYNINERVKDFRIDISTQTLGLQYQQHFGATLLGKGSGIFQIPEIQSQNTADLLEKDFRKGGRREVVNNRVGNLFSDKEKDIIGDFGYIETIGKSISGEALKKLTGDYFGPSKKIETGAQLEIQMKAFLNTIGFDPKQASSEEGQNKIRDIIKEFLETANANPDEFKKDPLSWITGKLGEIAGQKLTASVLSTDIAGKNIGYQKRYELDYLRPQELETRQLQYETQRSSVGISQLRGSSVIGATSREIISGLQQYIQLSNLGDVTRNLQQARKEYQSFSDAEYTKQHPEEAFKADVKFKQATDAYNNELQRSTNTVAALRTKFEELTQLVQQNIQTNKTIGATPRSQIYQDRAGLNVFRGLYGGALKELEKLGVTRPEGVNKLTKEQDQRFLSFFGGTAGAQFAINAEKQTSTFGGLQAQGFNRGVTNQNLVDLVQFYQGRAQTGGIQDAQDSLNLFKEQKSAFDQTLTIENEQLDVLHQINDAIRIGFRIPDKDTRNPDSIFSIPSILDKIKLASAGVTYPQNKIGVSPSVEGGSSPSIYSDNSILDAALVPHQYIPGHIHPKYQNTVIPRVVSNTTNKAGWFSEQGEPSSNPQVSFNMGQGFYYPYHNNAKTNISKIQDSFHGELFPGIQKSKGLFRDSDNKDFLNDLNKARGGYSIYPEGINKGGVYQYPLSTDFSQKGIVTSSQKFTQIHSQRGSQNGQNNTVGNQLPSNVFHDENNTKLKIAEDLYNFTKDNEGFKDFTKSVVSKGPGFLDDERKKQSLQERIKKENKESSDLLNRISYLQGYLTDKKVWGETKTDREAVLQQIKRTSVFKEMDLNKNKLDSSNYNLNKDSSDLFDLNTDLNSRESSVAQWDDRFKKGFENLKNRGSEIEDRRNLWDKAHPESPVTIPNSISPFHYINSSQNPTINQNLSNDPYKTSFSKQKDLVPNGKMDIHVGDINITGFDNIGKGAAAKHIVAGFIDKIASLLDSSNPTEASLKDKFTALAKEALSDNKKII